MSPAGSPAPALAGVRVLDMASLYAAPLIATLLADHGADVVKVEPPAGDTYRSWPAMWALVGRGKRSLVLDLGVEADRERLRGIIPQFDVVIENLPRPLAERRALTPEALRAIKPSLVVVSATGFGHDGELAEHPANGTIGEAFAGLTGLTGDHLGQPMLPSVPLGDALAAAFGAMGALAAVVRQLHTGEGAYVDVSVYEPVLHALGPVLPGYQPGVTTVPTRDGGSMGVPLRGTFETSDAQWVAISCSTPRHTDAVAELVAGDPALPLRRRAADWISGGTRDEVLQALVAARVPVTAVNDLRDVAGDPHVVGRGSLRRVDGLTVAAPTPRIDGDPVGTWLPTIGDANEALLG
ncbi:MAG: CoA transferase [Actinomycetota bacterium]|nr:CoA transferase [Actinomycetota bacterium]